MNMLKKFVSVLTVISLICISFVFPAYAANTTILAQRSEGTELMSGITSTNQYNTPSGVDNTGTKSSKLEYGIGGKLDNDSSAHYILDPLPTDAPDYVSPDSHKQFFMYNVNNYTTTGFVVMEANVLPTDENMGYFTILTANNHKLAQNKEYNEIGIIPGRWNNIRAVVNMDTMVIDQAPYRYPDVLLYVNGKEYNISAGTTNNQITSYNPGRMIFSAEKKFDKTQDIYWDDLRIYTTDENPGAQKMPTIENGNGYTVSDNKITLTSDVSINSLSLKNTTEIRVYDDSSLTSVLDKNTNLNPGNVIIAADETNKLYTTYQVTKSLKSYTNGRSVFGISNIGSGRFVESYKDGYMGKADGDISLFVDSDPNAPEVTAKDAIFYQFGSYTMNNNTAKYLVVELEYLPEQNIDHFSMRTSGHYQVTPMFRSINSEKTDSINKILPGKWNKISFVIENTHISDGTSFNNTAVTESVAMAGKHKLTAFINGEKVLSNYSMPFWGIKWGSRTGNILRIGYTAAGAEKTTHTKASFDNIRIYEMSSYSESYFTNQPKIIENQNSVYTVSDNTVTVYSEFSAKVSEIATDKNASIKVYTDSTLVNRMSDDEQLGNGNVIAISNGNGVFYYDVKSVSSGNNHFVYADTKEQWTSLNTTNALTDNPIGKPAGDGALNLSPSVTESIKCWNGFDGNGNVITEFNAFGEQNANINVSVGSLNFGSISIDAGKWNKVTLFANSSEGIKLYVNGNVIKSDSKMPDLANASLIITSDKNILIDDLKSFATNLNGEISYSPGIVYENENIISGDGKVYIRQNTTKISTLPTNGDVYVLRNGSSVTTDDYIKPGDVLYIDNNSCIGSFTVEGFSVNYQFSDNIKGSAKGTISFDIPEKYQNYPVTLYWANTESGKYQPLSEYLPIKELTVSQLEKGYTISKNVFIPQIASALIARVNYNNIDIDFTFDIPSNKKSSDTEPELIIALSSDYHFGDGQARYTPSKKHQEFFKHANEYADMVAVVGDIVTWWGSHSEAQIKAYQENKGPVSGAWENNPSQFDVATEYFKQFTIPVYMAQGNHDVPETGRYNINATYGATCSWRYSDYLNNWIDYSIENGYYQDAIEREVDKTYTGPSDKSNLATFYDDYVNGYHLVFLRVPYESGGTAYYDMMQQDLEFLDRKLYENENSGMPTFVFVHVPIENTIGRDIEIWENSQLRQQALKDILAKHPTSIVVSGHSHFALNNEWTWTIDGGGISPSYVHDGGFQSQKIPVEGDGSGDITEYDNATCVYAEIYGDKVVTRGYDIMKGKFIPLATSQITRNEDSTIGEISVSKVVEGNIVHLKAECDDDVSFEWSAADGTTKADILSLSSEYDGFVAVRATKSATDYRSVSFKSVDEIEVGSFETPDYAEGRTDCIITASSDDTYKLFNGQANGTFEYVTGIGGKSFSDESGKNAIESCGRVWSYPAISSSDNGLRYWKKQSANSKYLVFSMNVMPASEDTVYALIGTNGGSPTTAKSTDNLNKYQWNKLVGVYNIAFGTIDTYINGKLVSDDVTTTFSSGKDIRITFEGSSYLTTDDFDITGYIDDVEIYETEKLPLLLWSEGAKDIYSGSGITVDEQNGKITLSDSMTVKEFTDITGMTISGKDGLTKAENEVIQKGDFAVFYDNSAKAYSYYQVNFGYSIAFTSGVENNVITGEKVSSNVSVTDAGVVFIAQYDNEHNFINVQIADVVKGNNTIEFNKAANAKYVRIFAMNSKSKLVPVGKQTELTVK